MITNETAKSIYTIADGVTSYAVGFLYNKNPDGTPQIKLYLNNHPELPLVYGTDYTLSGDELSVVLLDNYSVGDRLHILRNIPMVQLSDYVIGRIDPEQVETDFDESVMRDQQLKAEIDTLSELPIDHEQRITTIEEEIPDEASSSNQLADKAYVGTQINAHTSRTDNPHSVTAAQIGLGNCDNTSDANKPVSTATQNALDLKANSADLATVATSGSYADLSNTPTLGTMAAESASDYTPSASLATVATSGLYSDLSGTPTVPTTLAALTGDVSVSTPTAGDHLVYNGTSQKWENTPSSAAISWGGITGDPKNQTDMLNVSNWSSNVTNCITEIPQDIKLELNNGTLTLKAGSKVYVPNGVGSFDELIIQNDLTTITVWGQQVQLGLFVKSDGSTMFIINMEERCSSGSSAPTATNIQMWYDTTNNLVKRYVGGADTGDRYSLPIALVQKADAVESSNISSINQVFNGFGYIGSTVFALPGVKGLIPNGRNNDGSLKNTEFTTQSVSTETFASNRTEFVAIQIKGDATVGSIGYQWNGYNEKENKKYNLYNRTEITRTDCGSLYLTNGVISNFKYKTPFHTVDYNDSEYIANCAMPSNKYVDLTLGADGSTYTAPADGYFTIRGSATAAGGFVVLSNEAKQMTNNPITYNPGGGLSAFLPVEKGDVVYVWYSNYSGSTFRFVYANGAQ